MKASGVQTGVADGPSRRGLGSGGMVLGARSSRVPYVSPWLLRWFRWYSVRYLKRHFNAVRLSRACRPDVPDGVPLVVYLNHPAWWDPLIGLVLAHRLFPGRATYAPMEAESLGQYRFMERLGLFGIDTHSAAGGFRFLRVCRSILASTDTAVWITPEGQFADPRQRAVRFRPGLAHLARSLHSGVLLPLAIEYPFWDERTPEALTRFGESISVAGSNDRTVAEWNALLEAALRNTQDALAEEAMRRDVEAFEVLIRGRAGVGGAYDLWRWLVARLRGKAFSPGHGAGAP